MKKKTTLAVCSLIVLNGCAVPYVQGLNIGLRDEHVASISEVKRNNQEYVVLAEVHTNMPITGKITKIKKQAYLFNPESGYITEVDDLPSWYSTGKEMPVYIIGHLPFYFDPEVDDSPSWFKIGNEAPIHKIALPPDLYPNHESFGYYPWSVPIANKDSTGQLTGKYEMAYGYPKLRGSYHEAWSYPLNLFLITFAFALDVATTPYTIPLYFILLRNSSF